MLIHRFCTPASRENIGCQVWRYISACPLCAVTDSSSVDQRTNAPRVSWVSIQATSGIPGWRPVSSAINLYTCMARYDTKDQQRLGFAQKRWIRPKSLQCQQTRCISHLAVHRNKLGTECAANHGSTLQSQRNPASASAVRIHAVHMHGRMRPHTHSQVIFNLFITLTSL